MSTLTALHLTTADEIATGLEHIGIRWTPAEVKDSTQGCLYTWVAGLDGTPPSHRGVLYVGVDSSRTGGRVKHESRWIETGIHAQGLALNRTRATCLAGAPDLMSEHEARSRWLKLEDRAANYPGEVSAGQQWLGDQVTLGRLLAACEVFAVRLSVHIGDVGAPVNSQFKGAWAMKQSNAAFHADNLAFWVARLLGEKH